MPKKVGFSYEDDKLKAALNVRFSDDGSIEIEGTSEPATGTGLKATANITIPKEQVEQAKKKLKNLFQNLFENLSVNPDNITKQIENIPDIIKDILKTNKTT